VGGRRSEEIMEMKTLVPSSKSGGKKRKQETGEGGWAAGDRQIDINRSGARCRVVQEKGSSMGKDTERNEENDVIQGWKLKIFGFGFTSLHAHQPHGVRGQG